MRVHSTTPPPMVPDIPCMLSCSLRQAVAAAVLPCSAPTSSLTSRASGALAVGCMGPFWRRSGTAHNHTLRKCERQFAVCSSRACVVAVMSPCDLWLCTCCLNSTHRQTQLKHSPARRGSVGLTKCRLARSVLRTCMRHTQHWQQQACVCEPALGCFNSNLQLRTNQRHQGYPLFKCPSFALHFLNAHRGAATRSPALRWCCVPPPQRTLRVQAGPQPQQQAAAPAAPTPPHPVRQTFTRRWLGVLNQIG